MFTLIAVTFSALKGTALAVAIVNAVVLAAVLVCLFLAVRCKKEPEKQPRSFFDKAEKPDISPDKPAQTK